MSESILSNQKEPLLLIVAARDYQDHQVFWDETHENKEDVIYFTGFESLIWAIYIEQIKDLVVSGSCN